MKKTSTKNKKPQKKKIFQGFYPPNAKLDGKGELYKAQLVGTNPEGRSLNSGW